MKSTIVLVLAALVAIVSGASFQSAGGHESVFSPHIIGGKMVEPPDRPYTVRLTLQKEGKTVSHCGGARLNYNWFITAAECLNNETYTDVQLTYPTETPKHYQAIVDMRINDMEYAIHPEYSPKTKINNLALFRCSNCEVVDLRTLPLLPKKKDEFEHFTSKFVHIVSGWINNDKTGDNQEYSHIESYETHLVRQFTCELSYFFRRIKDEHICASTYGGKRLSAGDTGVPLVTYDFLSTGLRHKLVGIATSIRPWTSILPVPTVYTRIAPHIQWISAITGIALQD